MPTKKDPDATFHTRMSSEVNCRLFHGIGCQLGCGPADLEQLPIATRQQPAPNGTGQGKPILPLVIADLQAREQLGKERYGEILHSNNGRDALADAYQEALDLPMYLRQEIEDRSELLELLARTEVARRDALARLAAIEGGAAERAARIVELEAEVAELRERLRVK